MHLPTQIKTLLGSFIIALVVSSCATSPTGQTQLRLIPEAEINQMGAAAYQDLKKKTPQSKQTSTNRYVSCIANAITAEIPGGRQWEITVFEDKAVNAFALPGGKIGVYTGLLDVAKNQDQLAAVIAHEVSHVIADHSNARMSASLVTQSGLQLAQTIVGAPSPTKDMLVGLLGVGAQYGVLMPYGRGQESEADLLGLDFMARAGFDPRASIDLWQNMSRAGGAKPPEFLSTHPSDQTRINNLSARMQRALSIYETARANGKRPACGR